MKQLDLANEKVGKLLRSFAVPCVISLLVAALYNIVDQIYIGHISGIDPVSGRSISILCNGATNVVYPFTLIALALCLLVGDGSAAVTDVLTGILTFVFITSEFKKLNKTNNLPVDKSSVE